MIVVDSSVWISHFADVPHPEVLLLRSIEEPEEILVGDLVLMEVLRGVRSEQAARVVDSALREFDQAAMVDADLARAAAANYRALRSRGLTIRSSIDLLVGTFCIARGHQLLHRERDFDHMQSLGLEVYPA